MMRERADRAFAILFATAVLAQGCKTRAPAPTSEVKDLVVSKSAKNVALVMSGLNRNAGELAASKEAAGHFKVALQKLKGAAQIEVREHHDVSTENVLKYTKEAAAAAGPTGTLIWYIGTHGWNDSFATAGDGRVKPAELMDALRAGRPEKPLVRLLMFFDYCGSGGMVEGLGLNEKGDARPGTLVDLGTSPQADTLGSAFAAALEAAGPSGAGLALAGGTAAFNQALFFAPATRIQTTSGNRFTQSMAESVGENFNKPGFTVRQFLDLTVTKVRAYTTTEYPNDGEATISAPQTAVYRALPTANFLNEPLFSAPPVALP